MIKEIVRVDLGTRSYQIVIEPGIIARAGDHIVKILNEPRVFIVSDSGVAGHYLEPLKSSLTKKGITAHSIIIPAGEGSKSFAALEKITSEVLAHKPERGSTLIALGGGVVGDLTGFAASIILRGVNFVQIPTTLLSQVDSSVGGKTGINTGEGKNLVGSFYQPRMVLADTGSLRTLPAREFRSGLAEVIKYGLIADEKFFSWLEENIESVLDMEESALTYIIAESCRAKAAIVSEDEREQGRRALLNFGHTFGHALEAATGYGDRLTHGEGVAVGMCLATRLSAQLGLCGDDTVERTEALISRAGLPALLKDIGGGFEPAGLLSLMRGDKKAAGGRIRYILTRGIGQAFVSPADDEEVLKVLK